MIKLPFTDPGNPDTRSPLRFLLWVARLQWTTLLGGITFGVIWMVAQALMPAAIGQAIQRGIVDNDNQALVRWSLILLGLGATQSRKRRGDRVSGLPGSVTGSLIMGVAAQTTTRRRHAV